jgi:hypothetical protein
MDAIKQFIETWWLIGPILAWLAWLPFSIWRSARRLARLSASESKIRRGDTRELRTKAPFRRGDFAAKAEIVRRERVKGTAIAMVILVAWYPSLVAISRLVPTLPRGWLIAYQGILFVAAMGSYLAFTARGSRLTRRSGLICPACGMELVGIHGQGRSQELIQDRVLETGKCPECKKQLLDPAEVGPESQAPLTLAEHALYLGICAALLAGIIAMLYDGTRTVDANAWTRCRRLYDRAYTAPDSIVIDSTVARGSRITCGDQRRSNTPRDG